MQLDQFVDGMRAERDGICDKLAAVFSHWQQSKVDFNAFVEAELDSLGPGYINGIVDGALRSAHAEAHGDMSVFMGAAMSRANILASVLMGLFRQHGVVEDDLLGKVFEFLRWNGLRNLPGHRIAAYLFAAVARKAAAGQKRPPSRGMINDIRAISSYAPFVDAMLVDNECAALLGESPLSKDLAYRAAIYSLNTRDNFLAYLSAIEDATPASVRGQARDVYGPFELAA